jgi:hypothetical protein
MALSFPASPTTGQTSTQNGRTYSWTGYAWELVAASGGSGSVTIPASDANYASTLLLARFDNVADDSGPLNQSATIGGSAAISSTRARFGNTSAYFPPISAYDTTNRITYGSGATWDIMKADFTMECWLYATGIYSYSGVICRDNQSDRRNWSLLISVDGVRPLNFNVWNSSSATFLSLTDSAACPLNQWVHVAVVRDSGTFRMYRDGVQVASAAASSGTGTIATASGPLTVGALNENGNFGFQGYIDEVRVLSTCIYKNGTTFTPSRFAVPVYVAPQTVAVAVAGGVNAMTRTILFGT